MEVLRDNLRLYAQRNGLGEDFVAERMNSVAVEMRNAVSQYEEIPWYFLTKGIVDSINEEIDNIEQKNSKQIIFGTLGTGDVNGKAIDHRNSDYYIVLIDDGVFTFANLLAKAMASSMPLKPGGGVEIDRDPTAIDRWVNQDEYSHKPFVELFLYYAIGGNPNRAPQYDVSEKYETLSHAWRSAMEFFILAHEFGHARRGHLDAAMHSPIPNKGFAEIALNWDQEFEADRFGLQLTLRCLKKVQRDQSITYAGIEMFFHGLEMFYRTLARFRKIEYADEGNATHPSLHLRISNLRSSLRGLLTDAEAKEAEKLASLAEAVLITMRDEIERHVDNSVQNDGAKLHAKWRPKTTFLDRVASLLSGFASSVFKLPFQKERS
jgi:hypothetical protein